MGSISRGEKVTEAAHRMEMMGIHPDTIKQFQNEGKVSRSEPPLGRLFWVEGWDLDRIEQFEEDHNALVYLMIRSQTEFGLMDSYLFVSDYPEEWEEDRADILAGQVLAYVFNHDAPDCSEFGAIGIEKTPAASVLRTW